MIKQIFHCLDNDNVGLIGGLDTNKRTSREWSRHLTARWGDIIRETLVDTLIDAGLITLTVNDISQINRDVFDLDPDECISNTFGLSNNVSSGIRIQDTLTVCLTVHNGCMPFCLISAHVVMRSIVQTCRPAAFCGRPDGWQT